VHRGGAVLTAGAATPARDTGFTLVELVVSIAVLGIVMTGIAAAMFGALTTNRSSDVRLGESRDARLSASYFADDVAGASAYSTGGTARCGPDAPVVELRGHGFDPALADRLTITAYVLRSATAADGRPTRVLHRLWCQSADTSPVYPLTPAGDIPVARLVSTGVDPAVTCFDAARAVTACSTSGIVTVRLVLTSRSGDLVTTLSGHRRTTP
jgi:prepilin-type N-terminal cleavage/methylation domain-containing protein